MKTRASEGDIVALPDEDGGAIVAQVLFVSRRTKEMAILRAWPISPDELGEDLPGRTTDSYVVFVNRVAIDKGDWPTIGRAALDEQSRDLCRFYTAGNVWDGDEFLGPASDLDREQLPNERVLGNAVVPSVASMIRNGDVKKWLGFLVPAER